MISYHFPEKNVWLLTVNNELMCIAYDKDNSHFLMVVRDLDSKYVWNQILSIFFFNYSFFSPLFFNQKPTQSIALLALKPTKITAN